jgi:hypothetical protein
LGHDLSFQLMLLAKSWTDFVQKWAVIEARQHL